MDLSSFVGSSWGGGGSFTGSFTGSCMGSCIGSAAGSFVVSSCSAGCGAGFGAGCPYHHPNHDDVGFASLGGGSSFASSLGSSLSVVSGAGAEAGSSGAVTGTSTATAAGSVSGGAALPAEGMTGGFVGGSRGNFCSLVLLSRLGAGQSSGGGTGVKLSRDALSCATSVTGADLPFVRGHVPFRENHLRLPVLELLDAAVCRGQLRAWQSLMDGTRTSASLGGFRSRRLLLDVDDGEGVGMLSGAVLAGDGGVGVGVGVCVLGELVKPVAWTVERAGEGGSDDGEAAGSLGRDGSLGNFRKELMEAGRAGGRAKALGQPREDGARQQASTRNARARVAAAEQASERASGRRGRRGTVWSAQASGRAASRAERAGE